jgi:conjugal transfer/entry exclusion protein
VKTYLYLLLAVLVASCSNIQNNNELEEAFFSSRDYSEGDDLELKTWFELDSIFYLKKVDFEKNINTYENETKVYNNSLIEDYNDLRSTFYKNYLMSKIDNLELFVQDIDFESAANKIDEVFNGLYDEFYELNSKMSTEDRKEIAERIGEFSATYLTMGIDSISEELSKNIEDFSKDFEDLSTQIESTLKKLFK